MTTDLVSDEEAVRNALRRLNPEFHTMDASWSALDRIIERERRLVEALRHPEVTRYVKGPHVGIKQGDVVVLHGGFGHRQDGDYNCPICPLIAEYQKGE